VENTTTTQGAVQLNEEVARRKETGVDVARKCGVTAAQISRILSGDRLPGRSLSVAFRDLYGVEPSLWDKPAKHAAKVATPPVASKRRGRPASKVPSPRTRAGARVADTGSH
jgi:transcriptional regulator with XRE-family HTH domain